MFVTVTQEDPRYNPNGTAPNGKAPFNKPSKQVDEYTLAIGVVVVRKRVLQAKRKGSQLQVASAAFTPLVFLGHPTFVPR